MNSVDNYPVFFLAAFDLLLHSLIEKKHTNSCEYCECNIEWNCTGKCVCVCLLYNRIRNMRLAINIDFNFGLDLLFFRAENLHFQIHAQNGIYILESSAVFFMTIAIKIRHTIRPRISAMIIDVQWICVSSHVNSIPFRYIQFFVHQSRCVRMAYTRLFIPAP